MISPCRTIAVLAIRLAACCGVALAQAPPIIIQIDVENFVEYQQDGSDVSKFGTNPKVTPAGPLVTFGVATALADIVAVNGQPAKGTIVHRSRDLVASPSPRPGQAIADITRAAIREQIIEILQSDGTPVGTIMAEGLSGGTPPPGEPVAVSSGGNLAIVGGTGAFLGARGQEGQVRTPQTVAARTASFTEDPANRRINGGGKIRWVLNIIPMSRPEVIKAAGGPAIAHSDFSLVTASKPAAAGEVLSLFATGLGPTRPGVDPGQPFPSSPLMAVNSPVDVTVDGTPAEVLAAVGYPGAVDGYQVNFRLPPDTGKGIATIQLSAAWIAGTPVAISVQ